MRSEIELLLLCGRVELDDPTLKRIREVLSGELQWAFLIPTAHRHGMLPLLHHHLRTVNGAVPAAVLRQLSDAAVTVTRRNLRLTAQMLELNRALDAARIPVIFFKGPTLALSAYGNLALRPFSDLDILVRSEDVRRTADLLRSEGFDPSLELTDTQERLRQKFQYASGFRSFESRLQVDLHWTFGIRRFSRALPLAELWHEVRQAQMPGGSVPTFSSETLLLALCWHGAKHGPAAWPQLLWMCDIAQLLRKEPRLDWVRVLRDAERFGIQRIVSLGVTLASQLFGAPMPKEVLDHVRHDPAVEKLAAPIRARLLGKTEERFTLRHRVHFDIQVRERLRDKLTYGLARLLLPGPRELGMVQLPRLLTPLYIPLRIARLSVRSVRRRLSARKE